MVIMDKTHFVQRLTILNITVISSIFISVLSASAQEAKSNDRDGQSPALTKSAADQYLLKDNDRQLTKFQQEVMPVSQEVKIPKEEELIHQLSKGSSSRFARRSALSELPLDKLTPANRINAEYVLKDISMFRVLPKIHFEVSHVAYSFFVAHPDVIVSIWRDMKISEFQMWQTGPKSFEIDAGDGSVGTLEVIHHTPTETMVLCSGVYKSPLLKKPISARALLYLETQYHAGSANKRESVSHKASMYVSFPSQTIEMAAKILAPVSNAILDRNFKEISIFMHMMSLAMERQPGWVERVANRLEGVLPVRKPQLLKVAAHVYINGEVGEKRGKPNRLQPPQPIDRAVSRNNSNTPRKLPASLPVKSASRANNPM